MFNALIDVFGFVKTNKRYWLGPVIGFLVLIGTLLVFAQGSVIAPFIYAVF
jgi:hypothetical protein